jgi:hypothetical protein
MGPAAPNARGGRGAPALSLHNDPGQRPHQLIGRVSAHRFDGLPVQESLSEVGRLIYPYIQPGQIERPRAEQNNGTGSTPISNLEIAL